MESRHCGQDRTGYWHGFNIIFALNFKKHSFSLFWEHQVLCFTAFVSSILNRKFPMRQDYW